MKVLVYCRAIIDVYVVGDNALEHQFSTTIKAIVTRGWELEAHLTGECRLSGKMNRSALTGALNQLDRGGTNVLVMTKLVRLSRSPSDFAILAEWGQGQ